MKLLLTNAQILDSNSPYHSQKTDLLIEDGMIVEVGQNLSYKRKIDLQGRLVAPGLVDMFTHFNEPGFEQKEDIRSGVEAAIFSGFTDVCLIPNTYPIIETKSDVSFLISRSTEITLHPIAAVSEGAKGENLTEILDLNEAGAVAFSDGTSPIWNSELLLKALQYVQKFNGLIITRAKDIHLSQFSHMHEGTVSTSLGLKGEPALSEEVSIKRDLDILRYAGGRLHFTHLSSAGAVELIKEAKRQGLNVTCDVAIHQLLYTDQSLLTFDSNLKVDPPFRSEKDRRALIAGVRSGVIDAVVSSHQPQDPESKELEFDLADYGICALPTVFSNMVKLSDEIPLEILVQCMTSRPRAILGLDDIKIEEGSKAKLSVFDPNKSWRFDASTNPSKSVNSPQYGHELKGRCMGIINGNFVSLKSATSHV